jgi:hypothetical protein
MQEAEAEVTARLMDREVTSTAKVLKKLIYGLERL